MSHAIQIKVSETVTRTVHVGDSVQVGLSVLPIQDPGEQARVLGEVLRERGFVQGEDGTWSRQDEDIRIQVDPNEQKVSVSVEEEETVSVSKKGTARGDTDFGDEKSKRNQEIVENKKKDLRRDLDREIEAKKQEKQQELTKKLEQKLQGLNGEMNEITREANKRNLEAKARQIGEVVDLQQSGNGDVSIKVRI